MRSVSLCCILIFKWILLISACQLISAFSYIKFLNSKIEDFARVLWKILFLWVAVTHACNPSTLGGRGERIAWTQEAEVAVNWDCATALQPGNSSRLCLKNKQQQKYEKEKSKFAYTSSLYLLPSTIHVRCDSPPCLLPWLWGLPSHMELWVQLNLFLL